MTAKKTRRMAGKAYHRSITRRIFETKKSGGRERPLGADKFRTLAVHSKIKLVTKKPTSYLNGTITALERDQEGFPKIVHVLVTSAPKGKRSLVGKTMVLSYCTWRKGKRVWGLENFITKPDAEDFHGSFNVKKAA